MEASRFINSVVTRSGMADGTGVLLLWTGKLRAWGFDEQHVGHGLPFGCAVTLRAGDNLMASILGPHEQHQWRVLGCS